MTKLLEGYYKAVDHFYKTAKNEGGEVIASDGGANEFPLRIQYGDFGEADPRIQEKSGQKNYNIKLFLSFGKNVTEEEDKSQDKKAVEFIDLGVLYDGGRKCATKEAPPGSYKIQPENQGKIIWFTGAPGMGKSTTAQILARNHGYVYYEADCFGSMKNPYIPLDVANPSIAQIHQKNLKGPGMEERKSLLKRSQDLWQDLMSGEEYDEELLMEYHREMALDIHRERKRIGGDFAVACVLLNKDVRSEVRKVLGPDLVIVCLTMPYADKRERVLERHEGDVTSADMMDLFESMMEPVHEEEPNTIELQVTSSMTRDEVVEEVRKRIKDIE